MKYSTFLIFHTPDSLLKLSLLSCLSFIKFHRPDCGMEVLLFTTFIRPNNYKGRSYKGQYGKINDFSLRS